MTELIDFHTHIRPPWWAGATDPSAAGLGPGADERIDRLTDLGRLIDESADAGISRRALSVGVEAVFGSGGPGDIPAAEVYRINEFTAEAVSKAPDLFFGLATIDASGEDGAAQAEHAVRELGLHGLFLDAGRGPVTVGMPETLPTLATAAELGVPVFVHPVWADGDAALAACAGQPGRSFGRGFTNGLSVLTMLHQGVFVQFPELDVVITALGVGSLLFAADAIERYRSDHGAAPRLHVDTLRLHPPTIRYLVDILGSDRVLLGSDWPIRTDAYAGEIEAAFTAAGLTAEEHTAIASGNARRLLGLDQEAPR